MTELEKHLLSTLEALQIEHDQQQKAWSETYEVLQEMFETTRQENSELKLTVTTLNQRLEVLTGQITRLAEQIMSLKR